MTEHQDMSNAVARTVDTASHNLTQAAEKLADVTRQAAHALQAKGDQLRYAQTRVTRECRHFVRERPLTSISIAVAGGFLLSWVLSRQQR